MPKGYHLLEFTVEYRNGVACLRQAGNCQQNLEQSQIQEKGCGSRPPPGDCAAVAARERREGEAFRRRRARASLVAKFPGGAAMRGETARPLRLPARKRTKR